MRARVILATALAMASASTASAIELVRGGNAVATIVVAQKAPDPERFAASELQVFVEKMSGVRLTIADKPPADAKALVVVGLTAIREAAGAYIAAASNPLQQLQGDGYVAIEIPVQPPALLLFGKVPRGSLYAVYDLLEASLDCGLFVDGDNVPKSTDVVVPTTNVVANPAFSDRTYWVPLSLYGPKRFQATLWNADEWRTFVRWVTKRKMNRIAIPFTTGTRVWGTAFEKAFPETKPHRTPTLAVQGAKPTDYTIRMGWGIHPEQTTALYKQVFDYARKIPGIELTYIFCLGEFEQSLRQAYPNLRWKPPVPPDFPAVAGGSCVLSADEPRLRELQAKLWKAIIETYGTDHNYLICCQEPANPIQGTGAPQNATALALEIIKQVDPDAKCVVPTWESAVWGANAGEQTTFIRQLPAGVTLLYAEEDFAAIHRMFDAARGFNPPPILTPTVRPLPARGILYTDTQFFADRPFHYAFPWGGGAGNDLIENRYGMLSNCFHHFVHFVPKPKAVGFWSWNQLRRVNPMMDDLASDFGWSSSNVWRAEGAATNRMVHRFLMRRYTRAAVYPMAEAYKEAIRGAPRADAPANYRAYGHPDLLPPAGLSSARAAVALAIATKATAQASPFFEPDLVDLGRNYLHQSIRGHWQAVLNVVQGAKQAAAANRYDAQAKTNALAELKKAEDALLRDHGVLQRLLATRRDLCLDEAIIEACATKDANPDLAKAIREQQSGLFAKAYPLVDTIEYHKELKAKQIRNFLDYAKRELDKPTAEAIPGWQQSFDYGAADFIESSKPQPFDQKAEKALPSVILQEYLAASE